jgi:hypothetical protein
MTMNSAILEQMYTHLAQLNAARESPTPQSNQAAGQNGDRPVHANHAKKIGAKSDAGHTTI